MKNENSNRVNMINATITFCDANTTATAGITGFAAVLAVVKGKIVLINSLNQIGDGTTKGVTTDTKLLRKTMTDHALQCGNATLGYANSINNNTLKALVNFTETKLNGMKKEDVDDACQGIHDATNTNIAGASNFGINATDVTDLQTAIDVYRTATQNPRHAIITKSQAIKQAATLIREVIDNLLTGQMDTMVNTLKVTNKNFWDGYKQAREIIDLGSTTAKVRGTVLDGMDVPLKGVTFTILQTGTDVKVSEVSSDVKGKFNAAKLPAGNFDFKWELKGYKTVIETNVHIAAGKELKRKIVMDAAIVREGDLGMGMIMNVDVNGVDGKNLTKITLEANNSPMRFYASNMPNSAPGAVFLDVPAGLIIHKTPDEFAAAVGFGNGNSYLNVQNIGGGQGHWRVTLEK